MCVCVCNKAASFYDYTYLCLCVCVCVCVCNKAADFYDCTYTGNVGDEWIWSTGSRRKTCPSPTLYTTTSTWTVLGLKPRPRGEKLAPSRLNRGTAMISNSAGCLERDMFLMELKIQLQNVWVEVKFLMEELRQAIGTTHLLRHQQVREWSVCLSVRTRI